VSYWSYRRLSHALARQQRITDVFLETAAQGFIQIDTRSIIVAINTVMAGMMGIRREDALGHSLFHFFDEQNGQVLRDQIARRHKGESGSYPITLTKANGTKIETWFYAKPIFDEHRNHIGSFAMVTDVTAAKHEAAKIYESEERYRTLFESSRDAIMLLNRGKIVDCNAAALEMFGVPTKEEMMGKSPVDFSPQYQADGDMTSGQKAERCVSEAFVKGHTVFDWIHVRANGECFYTEVTMTVVTVAKSMLLQAVIRDITERKRAEMAVAESEARYRAIFESSPVGLSLFDDRGVIRSVNPSLVGLFESSEERLVGVPFLERCENDAVRSALQRSLSGEAATYEGYYDSVTGTRKAAYMRLAFVPMPGNDDQFRVLGVVEDETQRKDFADELRAAKDAAEMANRAKSLFLANMSHEIRTPLNAVLGFAQLIQRQKDLTPKLKEYVDVIRRSGTHLLDLINDILEMSKIEAGREKLVPTAFDLHSLLEDIERMMRVRTEPKHVRVYTVCDDVPRAIVADQGKIRQVLINLLGNAAKFTDAGSIGVRATRCGEGMIAIDVSDTGCGIDPHEQDAVFRSFEQTSSGVRVGGTGLGMAISRGFAQLMGGNVVLVRSELGKGSVFRFTFTYGSCDDANVVEDGVSRIVAGLAPDTTLRTVLVVDDDANNRMVLEGLLTDVGFLVVCAESGERAVEVFSQCRPDAVLMDLRMPKMNGIEATKRIRALPSGDSVPVILVTASAMAEDRDIAFAEGIDAFVQKPFKESEIYAVLARVGHVTYMYAEEGERTPTNGTVDFSVISREVRMMLCSAVEEGDMQAFEDVLRSDVYASDAAEVLRVWAAKFEYQKILDALHIQEGI
jgi:PAS domain S-box-containing protein